MVVIGNLGKQVCPLTQGLEQGGGVGEAGQFVSERYGRLRPSASHVVLHRARIRTVAVYRLEYMNGDVNCECSCPPASAFVHSRES